MADTPQRPIIVKRKKIINGGSHGGAWKIAYADFVTAMMAFFLLMWLLGSVDGSTRGGIAEYFKTPLKVSLSGNSTLGESAIILHGGGKDLTKKSGQANNIAPAEPSKTFNLKNASEALEREEMIKMHGMKSKLDTLIESDLKLQPYRKQLLIDISSEGLRIQIVDESNRPMFALSSAELESRARDILRELAPTLNSMPNKISLSGHTDAKPFAQGSKIYSNWELSSDRAHDARRVLVEGGMDESKLMRVIGLSSSVLLDEEDPLNPINRRISIILLNKRAEQSAINEGRRQIAPPLN
ncbi:flagellar motor protein MotB [Methylobacter psychrophilus]|uniref:flagellar motor protein MotB n=1 Tax=Methylobacter psychrophilus TaxID=96941 RepID=UPI0021D4F9FA|nr:flagellar motor protein MotB [Methylobacter psychrophilus]